VTARGATSICKPDWTSGAVLRQEQWNALRYEARQLASVARYMRVDPDNRLVGRYPGKTIGTELRALSGSAAGVRTAASER